MRRGDVVIASMGGTGGKPRPNVVIQADEYIVEGGTLLLCPLTSELREADLLRPLIEPTRTNGLRADSQAIVQRVGSARPNQIGRRIGTLSSADMTAIDRALVNVLGLGLPAFGIGATG